MEQASASQGVADKDWPRVVKLGRVSVSIYRRKTPQGKNSYMVANYTERDAEGKTKRRFDSYGTEADAVEAAKRLCRQVSQFDVIGASMTRAESVDFACAKQTLEPYGHSITQAISAVVEAIKIVGDLQTVIEAAKFFKARNRTVTKKPISDAVIELLAIKKARGSSRRYIEDLRSRLNRFANDFQKDASVVSTADIQAWFDGKSFGAQNYLGLPSLQNHSHDSTAGWIARHQRASLSLAWCKVEPVGIGMEISERSNGQIRGHGVRIRPLCMAG